MSATVWFLIALSLALAATVALLAVRIRKGERAAGAARSALERLQAENRRLVEELERGREQRRSQLAATAHDIRSPLLVIRGFADMLARDLERGDRPAADRDVQRIEEGVDTLDRLVREFTERGEHAGG